MRAKRIPRCLMAFSCVLGLLAVQRPDTQEQSLAARYVQSYPATIRSVSPSPPDCVLRSASDLRDRSLELAGENFPTKDHFLQFREVSTGALSTHVSIGIHWESTTRIAVDMERIKHLLWDYGKVNLVVRITRYDAPSRNYAPISGWSPVFILARDAVACGTAEKASPPRSARARISSATPVPMPVRGTIGDLWADVIIGKPDFSEFTPYEVVPYKVFNPGGVVVDRSISPGRAYIWDSGNSRILGIDLATCYTNESPCSADIVIGQPSPYDHSACNGDSGFQRYPQRALASAATLCGIPEDTISVLENKSFVSMVVDRQGNLYVPDVYNSRVLKYVSPFTTDVIADEVWGQTDFTGNLCNGAAGDHPEPTASTLCFPFPFGAPGVELDPAGNLWVADSGNNRVLRFPKRSNGVIAKTADLVLGQPDFSKWSPGVGLDELNSPSSLRFGPQGRLYVVDSGNDRVLVFKPPFVSGMSAETTFGSQFLGPTGLEMDPSGEGVWINDTGNYMIELWDWDGRTVRKVLGKDIYRPDGACGDPETGQGSNPAICASGGGIGIDSQGNVLISAYAWVQDVLRFPAPIPAPRAGAVHQPDKRLFFPPDGYNYMGRNRLRSGNGVVVYANQLVVADAGRLLFWNGVDALANGRPADGVIGDSEFRSYFPDCCVRIKADVAGRLWVAGKGFIDVYQLPLGPYSCPIHTLWTHNATFPVLGGGSLALGGGIDGLAPVGQGEFIWISDTNNHRVLRIRNPLTDPLIDVVLGQTDVNGNQCNRGLVPPPKTGTDQVATADMLCYPGALSLDRSGNLYVSDHTAEAEGNLRLLLFAAGLFPITTTRAIFAPPATRSLPRDSIPAPFETAFDVANRMVVGYNPCLDGRFVGVYDDPRRSATPNAYLGDFQSWPWSATFDMNGNLYIGDGNRGRVLVYRNPFNNPPSTNTPTPLHTPTPTVTPISRYTVVIHSVSPAPPYCLLRNAPVLRDRCLVLAGESFPRADHALQFRVVGTGELSCHFDMEVNWESTTRITVDMGSIKDLLWGDISKMLLTVRVTNGSLPVSDWSPGFVLADDAVTCGMPQLYLPLVVRQYGS